MRVLKFGGTSLKNAKKIFQVFSIIKKKTKKEQVAIVLSAPATITDRLFKITEKILKFKNIANDIKNLNYFFEKIIFKIHKKNNTLRIQKIKKKIKKIIKKIPKIHKKILNSKKNSIHKKIQIISLGEQFSIKIINFLFKSEGYKTYTINPIKCFYAYGDKLNSSINIYKTIKKIKSLKINKKAIIFMPGFVAGNKKKKAVLLGRNGSDYSAAILSVCTLSKYCEIWTDVNGIYTADPKKIKNATLLKKISYKEAINLTYLGAEILHRKTILPLYKFNIPCIIKNTYSPNSKGTIISEIKNKKKIPNIVSLNNAILFQIKIKKEKTTNNVLKKICKHLKKKSIEIISLIKSFDYKNINLFIFKENKSKVKKILKKYIFSKIKSYKNSVSIKKKISIISITGFKKNKKKKILKKVFQSLYINKIKTIGIIQDCFKKSVSIITKKSQSNHLIKIIHTKLFKKNNEKNIFLIGIGGIGKTLIKIIKKQKKILSKKKINFNLFGIANSKKILIKKNGINLNKWEKIFKKKKENFSKKTIYHQIKKTNLPNITVIDCTSSNKIANLYPKFLKKKFNVIASNKKANTKNFSFYKKTKKNAIQSNCKFLYETNVGAGLPVIENLQKLLLSGDSLIKIRGILSGSLSFIFGKLEEGFLFSESIKKAQELGLTEPNPCDDLSGIDVARKLLILIREAGKKIELNDIFIESLLPKSTKTDKKQVKTLKENLPYLDKYFLKRYKKAKKNKKVLRFIATYQKNKECSVKIKEINKEDPFYTVKNSENALAFYTKYYSPLPLVLRGYGAGKNVTASGVFSDLLRIIS